MAAVSLDLVVSIDLNVLMANSVLPVLRDAIAAVVFVEHCTLAFYRSAADIAAADYSAAAGRYGRRRRGG